MFPRITSAQPIGDYRLRLSFSDGLTGDVDLHDWIIGRGGIFTVMEDPHYFAQVRVHPEFGTVYWPNEVDFDPDVLYSLITREPVRDQSDTVLSQ